MKRILMLNYEFPPLGGGTANANWHLLKEYEKYPDLEVDLVVASPDKYKVENFSKRIKIHRLNIGKNNKNLSYQSYKDIFLYGLFSLIYTWKLRLKNKYDLVHAFYGVPCGLVAFLLVKPYMVSLRGSDVPFYNKRFSILDRYFLIYLNKLVWGKAKQVIANSEDLKNLALKSASKIDIKVIPNGVDTNYFKPNSKVKKEKALLFVGRLIPRKRADLVIEAYSKLPKDLKDKWKVWIVGEGPEKINLQNLATKLNIEDKVKFWGHLDKSKLRIIYQKSRIYVLPSYNEGMSNTLLEALACGLPAIAANTGDSSNLIAKNMIIKNKKELSKKLKFLLNGNIKSSKSKTKIVSWNSVSEKYIDFYAQSI